MSSHLAIPCPADGPDDEATRVTSDIPGREELPSSAPEFQGGLRAGIDK